MRENLNKSEIERFSRQLVLKNIGARGQKKILSSKILIVGVGGLGCPAAENLVRAGIGTIGLIDKCENYGKGFVSNAVSEGEWNGYGNLRDDPTKCWTVRFIGGGDTDCESVYFSEQMAYESSTTVATNAKEGFFVSSTAYNDRILYLCQSDVNFHIDLYLSSDMIVYVKDLGGQNEVVTSDSSGTIVGDYGADITYMVGSSSNLEILDWNDPNGDC